jgi:hypothetical protein
MKEGKHIIYSAKDIHAYLTGKLTPQEMHAMERAALTDPMLAEAMEGFHETASFRNEKEFAQLQDQLNGLKKKIANRKDTRANNWWKMAAIGLLLVGIAVALRMLTTTPAKQRTIAAVQPVEYYTEGKTGIRKAARCIRIIINDRSQEISCRDNGNIRQCSILYYICNKRQHQVCIFSSNRG